MYVHNKHNIVAAEVPNSWYTSPNDTVAKLLGLLLPHLDIALTDSIISLMRSGFEVSPRVIPSSPETVLLNHMVVVLRLPLSELDIK